MYNNTREKITTNDDKPNDEYGNFMMIQELKAGIQYYVEIKSYIVGTGSYNLIIEKVNNLEGSIVKIDTRKECKIPLVYANREYMYEFTPEESGSYSITIRNCKEIECALYNSTKEEVISKGREIPNTSYIEIAHTLIKNITYYVKVVTPNQTLTDYAVMEIEQLGVPNDELFYQ